MPSSNEHHWSSKNSLRWYVLAIPEDLREVVVGPLGHATERVVAKPAVRRRVGPQDSRAQHGRARHVVPHLEIVGQRAVESAGPVHWRGSYPHSTAPLPRSSQAGQRPRAAPLDDAPPHLTGPLYYS
ncbi:MAG TPA: hypothetical protein VF897_06950 [Roseiflexaceae bacterium]